MSYFCLVEAEKFHIFSLVEAEKKSFFFLCGGSRLIPHFCLVEAE